MQANALLRRSCFELCVVSSRALFAVRQVASFQAPSIDERVAACRADEASLVPKASKSLNLLFIVSLVTAFASTKQFMEVGVTIELVLFLIEFAVGERLFAVITNKTLSMIQVTQNSDGFAGDNVSASCAWHC